MTPSQKNRPRSRPFEWKFLEAVKRKKINHQMTKCVLIIDELVYLDFERVSGWVGSNHEHFWPLASHFERLHRPQFGPRPPMPLPQRGFSTHPQFRPRKSASIHHLWNVILSLWIWKCKLVRKILLLAQVMKRKVSVWNNFFDRGLFLSGLNVIRIRRQKC